MSARFNAKVNTSHAFKYHWLAWKMYGLLPQKRDSKCFKPYAIILNFSILIFPASFVMNAIFSKNMVELCENLYNTITDLNCNIKFYNTLAIRDKLFEVHNILDRLDSRAKTPKDVSTLERGVAAARKLFLFMACGYFVALMTNALIAVFTKERVLMYPAWFPWDWRASKAKYLMTYCFQFIFMFLQAVEMLISDTYAPTYLIILSAHINALALRIENLGCEGSKCEETLFKELKDCIRDHNTIHELFRNIQEITSTICLVQFAATALAQCTMGVYIIYVGADMSKLPSLITYFAAVTMEVFILCYYGDLYCQANDNLTAAIYACNWIDRDEKFRKAMLFLLQRSQKSSILMAGNIIPVRMPTFVLIMKTAYSAFTVLNNDN